MNKDTMCFWLKRFVLEVRTQKRTEYTGKSTYSILCGLLRHLRENKVHDKNFLDEKDPSFAELRKTVNCKMQDLLENGIGTDIKQAEPLSESDESRLWDLGVFGMKDSKTLQYTMFFYPCKLFGLRGKDEHRHLQCSQFSVGSDSKGRFIRFIGRNSKTFKGGLGQMALTNKDIKHYCDDERKESECSMYSVIGIAMASLLLGRFHDVIAETDYNLPVDPATYALEMKQGFAANFVKSYRKLYHPKIVDDVYARGFRNFRLRLPADHYEYPYDSPEFEEFLDNLETVVDKCLDTGMSTAISWSNTGAGARASADDLRDFKEWWVKVAKRLKDKNYRLSLNLVTEIGGTCRKTEQGCDLSLRNETIYNIWMQQVINKIRNTTGGNNAKRIIILPSPRKGAWGLEFIHNETYQNDSYIMAEHHTYAGGPEVERQGADQYWNGTGTDKMKQTVYNEIALAEEYVPDLTTCWLAWSPIDIRGGGMNQLEAESFAAHFVSALKKFNMPWSMNQLSFWYDQRELHWITEEIENKGQMLNTSRILDVILENM